MDLRCHLRWHRCWHQEACGLTSPIEFWILYWGLQTVAPLSIFAKVDEAITKVDTCQLLFPSASLDRIAGWRADRISRGRDCPLSLRTSRLGTARTADTLKVVGGRGIRSPKWLSRAHGRRDELWPRNGDELFLEAQDIYKKLDRSRAGWCGWLVGIHLVGPILHARARVTEGCIASVSRQYERNPAQNKWTSK